MVLIGWSAPEGRPHSGMRSLLRNVDIGTRTHIPIGHGLITNSNICCETWLCCRSVATERRSHDAGLVDPADGKFAPALQVNRATAARPCRRFHDCSRVPVGDLTGRNNRPDDGRGRSAEMIASTQLHVGGLDELTAQRLDCPAAILGHWPGGAAVRCSSEMDVTVRLDRCHLRRWPRQVFIKSPKVVRLGAVGSCVAPVVG